MTKTVRTLAAEERPQLSIRPDPVDNFRLVFRLSAAMKGGKNSICTLLRSSELPMEEGEGALTFGRVTIGRVAGASWFVCRGPFAPGPNIIKLFCP